MSVGASARYVAILGGFLIACSGAGMLAPMAAGEEASVATTAQRLVADALRAEVDGNSARRRVLLSIAVDAAPDYEPARWHSGQVRANGEWLFVDKAQQAAAADPKRAEYQRLRTAGGNSLDGQLALARWCRKSGLKEEARFHWTTVLSHDPNNEEAQRARGVRWHRLRLPKIVLTHFSTHFSTIFRLQTVSLVGKNQTVGADANETLA